MQRNSELIIWLNSTKPLMNIHTYLLHCLHLWPRCDENISCVHFYCAMLKCYTVVKNSPQVLCCNKYKTYIKVQTQLPNKLYLMSNHFWELSKLCQTTFLTVLKEISFENDLCFSKHGNPFKSQIFPLVHCPRQMVMVIYLEINMINLSW